MDLDKEMLVQYIRLRMSFNDMIPVCFLTYSIYQFSTIIVYKLLIDIS